MKASVLGVKVLVVDDEEEVRRVIRRVLTRAGASVVALADGLGASDTVRDEAIDVVLLDWRMPHVDGFELLPRVRAAHPEVAVIMMTGSASVEAAVRALKLGAYDFLTKPFASADVLVAAVARASERRQLQKEAKELRGALAAEGHYGGFVGNSAPMRRVYEQITSVAAFPATVLVTGESGTGKELVARALHQQSQRATRNFVALNCSAMPEALLEAELFGHVKGAFTGAATAREGLFVAAHGGTIFLDEIGDLPLPLQAKLLRVLQEGEVRRLGSNAAQKVDARVVAATNVDLARARADGKFREDLYYRLDVVRIALPPLRERLEDVPLLAQHFLRKHAARGGKDVRAISSEAVAALTARAWPGNVRELENAIERAVIQARGERVEASDLTLPGGGDKASSSAGVGTEALPPALIDLPLSEARKVAMESFDRRWLEHRILRAGGNVSLAARDAGMDRANFRRLLKRYGLTRWVTGDTGDRGDGS